MISSLTRPELAKRIDSYKDLLENANEIAIISIKNTVAPQFMAKSSNIYLRKLQEISDATGRKNHTKSFFFVIEEGTQCLTVCHW